MKRSVILLLALLAALASRAQDYYSLQHPEWPPAPGVIAVSNLNRLKLYQVDANTILVDDRMVIYPTNRAVAATNSFVLFPYGDFKFDTNYVAAHPEQLEDFQRALRAFHSSTNEAAVLDRALRAVANAQPVAADTRLGHTNQNLRILTP